MGKSNQLNTLLVEILIAVLFFALSATVILETFVATRNQSRQASVYNQALVEAQNVADRLYLSSDFEWTLEREGFQQEEGNWLLQEAEYALSVTAAEEKTAAGRLLSAEINVVQNAEPLLMLPVTKYVPGEVQP